MFVRFIFVRFICVSAFCGFVSVLFTPPLSAALAQEDGAGPIPIAEETPGNSGGDGLPPFALPMGEGGPVLSLHGFARVDYAAGDRFGDDVFGVSKAALDFGVSMDNLSANIVLGTGDLTGNTPGDINGNVFIPDAFFTWTDIGGSGLTVSGGRRPILFGLKPAGFPEQRIQCLCGLVPG